MGKTYNIRIIADTPTRTIASTWEKGNAEDLNNVINMIEQLSSRGTYFNISETEERNTIIPRDMIQETIFSVEHKEIEN